MSETLSAAPPPAPPKRSSTALAFDVLIWGGVAMLLIVSFKPAEIDKFPQLFSEAGRMREFAQGFFSPFTDPKAFMAADWGLYVGKMWQTIQMALWGTFLAISPSRWACWARATSRRSGCSSRCAGCWT